jgi:hypothetical protein
MAWRWFFPPPGGPTGPGQGGAVGEHFWPRWSAWIGHSHVYASQPHPGAPAYAYEALGLVERTPIGAGTVNREQFRTLAGLTAFTAPGYRTDGLGGLVQGQYASAPLMVSGATPSQPDNNSVQYELGHDLYSQRDNWIG